MGIDPGTNTLGMARIDICPRTLAIVQSSAQTFTAERHVNYRDLPFDDGASKRFARLAWHEDNILYHLHRFQPYRVGVETNFLRVRMVSAYAALTETVTTIRRAVYRYNPNYPIHFVEPRKVKNAVNAKADPKRGRRAQADKDEVKAAIGLLRFLNFDMNDYIGWDEHACDSLAIAFYLYRELYLDVTGQPFTHAKLG